MNCEKINAGVLTGITSGLGILLLSLSTKEYGIGAALATSSASFILSMLKPASLQSRVSRPETGSENTRCRKILSAASLVFQGPIRVFSMDPQIVWFGIGRGLIGIELLRLISNNSFESSWATPIFALATTLDAMRDEGKISSGYLQTIDSPV